MFKQLEAVFVKKRIISDSNFIVRSLGYAAFAALAFSYITDGSVTKQLGLVPFSQLAMIPGATGDNDNTHEAGSMMHGEHDELFAMVPHSAATHMATGGVWSDPDAWIGGVPDEGSKVLIPEGVNITYDSNSAARINWIRVDGELSFVPDATVKLVVDTLVVDADGTLEIGTETNPVTGSVEIVIADNGDIDTSWDTLLQSRGIVTHGTVRIHGEEKTVHGKVASDPMTGDTSITMKDTPDNWQVGDIIVIAGTNYYGPDWYGRDWHDPQDEVRTITNISGKVVSFAEPLANNHNTPRSDLKTSVANYSRTVTIGSENGAAAETRHRGHVMFMHNNDVDVRYAAFDHLGRTNKALPSLEAVEFGAITPGSNVRGRYSLHIHRTSADDLSIDPVILMGNAVFNSPGWGYVHHDSYAILHNNASYDTFGAGFVAETGNEIGTWTNNIAIWAKGLGWKEPKFVVDLSTFDVGNTGDGFWFQGRLVKARNNIAASVNHGYAFFHRSPNCGESRPTCMLDFPYTVFDYPTALYNGLSSVVSADTAPVINFNDNEVFAARAGVQVTKHSPVQGHDVHTVLKRLTAWNVVTGAELTYTSHYHIEDFDLIGRDAVAARPGDFSGKARGVEAISLATNAADMVSISPKISNFERGISLKKDFTFNRTSPEVDSQFVVTDASFTNVGEHYPHYDASYDTILDGVSLPVQEFSVVIDQESLNFGRDGEEVQVTGLKYDGIGMNLLPAGADNLQSRGFKEIADRLGDDGYSVINGTYYFLLPQLFTDRFSGEVHKFSLPVVIDPVLVPELGTSWLYSSAFERAEPIDFSSAYPEAVGERETAQPNRITKFNNLLSNDSDPDGDDIELGGFAQPEHGLAYQTDDDEISYRPDFDYTGPDKIKYWVVDTNGKYSEAYIAINVTTGSSRPSMIEPAPARLFVSSNPSGVDVSVGGEGATVDSSATTAEPEGGSGSASESEPVPELGETTTPVSSPSSGGSSNNSSSGGSSNNGSSGGSSNSGSSSDGDPSPTQSGNNSGNTYTPPISTTIPNTFSFDRNISYIQTQLNDPQDVRYLQQFLNEFEGESLTVTGVYDSASNEAVKRFQTKYRREILDVWNLNQATGYVGITTRLKMNFLLKGQTAQCPVFIEYNGGISPITVSAEIAKTKEILADLDMYTGPINQVWTSQTHEALIVFQETFREVMLDPWNITEGTGYKYKTTNKFLNYFVGCDTGAVELEGVGIYEGI